MKKVAMLLSMILALGWISDAGMVTIKYDNGAQVKGIPMLSGYEAVFTYNGVTTSLLGGAQSLQYKYFGVARIFVNGKWENCTRLGNGWLFKFKERKATDAGRLSNR